MQKPLIALVSLLVLLAFPPNASSQYQFDSWNTDSGLPQNSVKAIVQTRDGYLWLTTSDGLVRYDGVRFTVFNKANTKGIGSNRFTDLFEGRDQSLWAGTEDGGLTRYKEGAFSTFTTGEGLPSNRVDGVREDSDGTLLALTIRGVARWDGGQKFDAYVSEDGLSTANYSTIWDRGDGFLSSFDAHGLHVFDRGRYRTYTTADGLPSLNITRLCRDQDGTLWLATKDAGLAHFKNGKFTVLPLEGLLSSEVIAAHEDRAGDVWVGTQSGQLAWWHNGHWTMFGAATGLNGRALHRIFEDREGSIWIGSFYDGLYRVRKQEVSVYTQQDGLSNDNVYPILEDSEGGVWAGTWGGGLSRLKDGKFVVYRGADGLGTDHITSLAQDSDGSLWIGSRKLTRLRDGRFTVFGRNEGYNGGWIFAIHQDHEGNLWLGADEGLYRFRDGVFTAYTTRDGLPNQKVQSIHEDRSGNLWLGTLGGLSVFRNGQLKSFTEQDGLASNHVRTIYEDTDGVLWIGSYDGGITRYKDGKFTTYTTKEGLYNNGAFQMLEDNFGNFWISCNLGIYRVSRSELNDFAAGKVRSITSIPYGRRDGMMSLECNGGKQPGGIKTRDGRLWFPTQKGMAVINPATAVATTLSPPPVLIEGLAVDRQTLTLRDAVHLSPGQESLEIRYTGLSFVAPEQIRFRYRLEGLDQEWVEAGSKREAYYSHLPPGEYLFSVIAANNNGIWNVPGASLRVIVHPPFWRTWWFLSLFIAGVVGLTVLGYHRRISKLKRAHAAQEAFSQQLIESQETERKRIAAELHDSLGQNLLVIKNRALLSLNSPEKTDNALEQLNEISLAASQAIEEVREIAHDLRPFQLDRLGLTKALESIARKVTASSGIVFTTDIDQIDDVFTKPAEINLYRIVQECINNIIKHSGATDARLSITRDSRGVLITISDNGKGFAPETLVGNRATKGGFGLIGISERARILGGKEVIRSIPGQGTTVTLMIGLQNGHG